MIPNTYKPLRSKAWLNQLSDEDRSVFGKIGYLSCLTGENKRGEEINLASIGGKANAAKAKRDKRGRFITSNMETNQENKMIDPNETGPQDQEVSGSIDGFPPCPK